MAPFHESQRLQPPRFRWLVAFPPALMTAFAAEQLWLGHPISTHALSNRGFVSVSVFLWFVFVWLCRVKLVTDVDETSVSIRLRGLLRHHRIPLGRINAASVVAFNPERDFGGYGIRAV